MVKGCVVGAVKWCWNSDNNAFPPVRVIFLAGTCFFFFFDIAIDILTAYEHYNAWKEGGSKTALDYFIATVFFVLFPSILINAISLALYVWGQCMLLQCNKRNYYHTSVQTNHHTYDMVYKPKTSLMKWEHKLSDVIWNKLSRNHKRKGSTSSTAPLMPLPPLNNMSLDNNSRDNIELQNIANTGVILVNQHSIAALDEEEGEGEETIPSYNAADVNFSTNKEVREQEMSQDHTPQSSREEGVEETDNSREEAIEETDSVAFYPIDEFNSFQFTLIVLLHIFQFGFIVRVCILLYKSRKDGLSFDRYRDISFLRLMEGFFEAAPQLLLQLYIITLEEIPDTSRKWITGIAVVFSMGSLALAIADYISAGKDILHYNPATDDDKKQRLTWGGYFLVIFWHLAMIVSRGISISLFATEYYGYVFVVGCAHYLLMVYWLYGESGTAIFKTNKGIQQQKSILCGHYGFELLAAVFNIFFPFRLRNEDSCSFLTSYYTVFFFENLLMISLWVVRVDYLKNLWYLKVAPITVVLTFILGILIMILYYAKCQPKPEQGGEQEGALLFHSH